MKRLDGPLSDADLQDFVDHGYVYILHPFMLHTPSQNLLRRPRIITNPAIALQEPMCFDRPDGDYNAVEQAILNALGVERLDYQIEGERGGTMNDGQRQRHTLKNKIERRFAAEGRSTSIL